MTDRVDASELDVTQRMLLFAVWLSALAGTVGSLFFSEVMGYPPCVLCWYQRIALYPLVITVAVGLATGDKRVAVYSLPFAVIGLLIAIYHNLLYFGVIPESITPCTEGTPCNARQLELFGFLTIPLMALGGFVVTTGLLLAVQMRNKK